MEEARALPRAIGWVVQVGTGARVVAIKYGLMEMMHRLQVIRPWR